MHVLLLLLLLLLLPPTHVLNHAHQRPKTVLFLVDVVSGGGEDALCDAAASMSGDGRGSCVGAVVCRGHISR
jgi:hypothetical protein